MEIGGPGRGTFNGAKKLRLICLLQAEIGFLDMAARGLSRRLRPVMPQYPCQRQMICL